MRWFGLAVALVALAGCGSKKDDGSATPPGIDARKLSCQHAPECVPAKPTPGRTCKTRDFDVTCSYCGDDGALLECEDSNDDGCFELIRTECGRPDGCEVVEHDADCKPLPGTAQNIFGAETPSGFVECNTSNVLPVTGDRIVAVVRTRGTLSAPAKWSVGVKGASPPEMIPAEYLDVEGTHAVLRQEVAVGNATEVELVYTIEDFRAKLNVTCGPFKLQR